jgi:uncharacterized SAM-binding protein YcdF (DUF218 family)
MKLIKKILFMLAIVASIVVIVPLFIGWYLSPQDKLQKSDAIVVVSGGDNNARIKKGVELYKEDWAPLLVFSGAAAKGDISNAKAMERIAVSMGVPSENILIEEKSKTTIENAKFTSDLLRRKGVESFILVTSPYHQRRTFNLFKKESPAAIIINQSALDENWRKKGWWQNNIGRFLTLGELSKIMLNYFNGLTGTGQ